MSTDEHASRMCDPTALAAAVRSGDVAALDRITRCYGDTLAAVGRRYCRTETDAEDAVQDALVSAGENLDSFRGDGSTEGWLVRMVINACRRMQRGRKNDPSLHAPAAEVALVGSAPDPESEAARGEVAVALAAALEELAPRDRAMLLLADAEDWSAPEIAAEFDTTPGAVRTRLHRIRARVRADLAAQAP